MEILLTGATGYVGGRLLPRLLDDGHDVRCLVRRPDAQLPGGATAVRGDVANDSPEELAAAMEGAQVAYYLVHSMGGGTGSDFAERDRAAAQAFGAAARQAGVERVVYLGGLNTAEDESGEASEHLRSRDEVARVLAEHVRTVHVRAAMVIGSGSASFQIMRTLARRLPVMVTPSWVRTRSQPVAIADVVSALAALAVHEDPPDEVQLGGADVLSYRDMLRRCAHADGRPAPLIVPTPVLSPGLSTAWVRLVTPVDGDLIRALVDGLRSEMVVRRPPPPGINDAPMGFDAAVRAAIGGDGAP